MRLGLLVKHFETSEHDQKCLNETLINGKLAHSVTSRIYSFGNFVTNKHSIVNNCNKYS